MYKSFSMELAGRTLTVDIGRVCAQANGAALIKYGETTVLSTVVASDKPRDGVDFFPLSVEFEEKMYAVGKIPGGFNKREGKASENAILTSRVIDRPMRPLFPKDYRNDVTLNNMVMSVDPECRPEVVGMIGSALVTTMSDIPFDGPCAMTQMGMVDGEFIVNPSQKVWDEGDLQLTVASTRTKVIMIEAGANEIPEEKMIEAMYVAAGIGQVIANRASLAGASGGCQAEIGSASGMAAAAICSVRDGSEAQMGYACAMALKNLMGLVCDPVAGLVEVPCVKRNVGGAVNALAAADMALAGIISQIPVDQVIDAMGEVGIKMDVSLRETSLGGVAVSPRGIEIAEKLGM